MIHSPTCWAKWLDSRRCKIVHTWAILGIGTQSQHEVHLFLSVWVWVCTVKARGSLCLISFRQSLTEPEAGLTIKSQPSSCLYPAQGMLYMSKITGNLFHRCCGLHAHLRFSQSSQVDCRATTPAPHYPSTTTNPVGVLFLWQCLTMSHYLLWWPGWPGILLFLIFYNSRKGNWHSILSALVPWLYVQPYEVTCIMTPGLAGAVRSSESYMEGRVRSLAPPSLLAPHFHKMLLLGRLFPSLAAAMLPPQQNQWPHFSRTLNQNKPLCFIVSLRNFVRVTENRPTPKRVITQKLSNSVICTT